MVTTAYPGALDVIVDPVATDHIDDALVGIVDLHGVVNNAIEAIEAKVGISASTPDTDKLLLGTGLGTSAWSTPATVRTSLGLVIGTNVQAYATVPSYDGIQFPAVQVPAAGANVLDDYEEGVWTPVFTFATPGDVAVSAYAANSARYTKIGNRVLWSFNIQISAGNMTYTTASGNLRITGLPFACEASGNHGHVACMVRGYTKANFTYVTICPVSAQSYMETLAGGSGQAPTALTTTDIPTASAIQVAASGQYKV